MKQDVLITGISSQLQGVGRAQDGRVLFIDGAIPGERVRVDIQEGDGRFLNAVLLEVLEASERRVRPLCPHYATCGGCQAQHMTYEESLRLKKWVVGDALLRLGGLTEPVILDSLPSVPDIRYRNKAEYAVAFGKVGFFKGESHEIVEVTDCLLQHPDSVAAMKVLRRWLSENRFDELRYFVTRVNPDGRMMLVLSHEGSAPELQTLIAAWREESLGVACVMLCRLKNRPAHALDGDMKNIYGGETLDFTLSGLTCALSAKSFFQVNTAQAGRLYACALEFADLCGDETVIDAYSGVGTIALYMARRAKKVIGVEIVREAVRDAERNARRNKLSEKASFLQGAAEAVIPGICKASAPDVVAFDPPRKGLDPSLLSACLNAKPKKIVYVSCNPATLARDVKLFVKSGLYRFEKARPVDMFPWTAHVECVVLMTKRE